MRLNGSLRFWLREETRPEHDAVDRAFGCFDLGDRADYTRFLRAHARAVLPLEAALDANRAALPPDWPERRRGGALLDDLRDLGAPAPAVRSASGLEQEAEALGALYVLEGSRLGARLLDRIAAASADPVVRGARRYLTHGQGAPLWAAFLRDLDASSAARKRPEKLLQGARIAFAAFQAAAPAPEPATF